MASITKNPNGGYRVQVKKNGVRKSDSFATKQECKLWAAQVEYDIEHAGKVFPRFTLGEALDKYMEEVSEKKKGRVFECNRIRAFKRDFAALCNRPICEIRTPDMKVYRDKRLTEVTPGSVQREINLFSNVFQIARKEWGWCGESPFTNLKAPGDNPPRDRRITPMEVRKLCRHLHYHTQGPIHTKGQQVALAWLIGIRTGMRAGEILSLRVENVDLEGGVVKVDHKMQYLTGKPRTIPLTRHGRRLLKRACDRVREEGGALFSLTPRGLDGYFRKARAAAGLEGFTFHDSRAEALTRLSKKMAVQKLQRISGHTDINILINHYYREDAREIARSIY